MMAASIQAEVEARFKRKILSFSPLSAANNAEIFRMAMEGGAICVAKVAEKGLDVEAYMLDYLKTKSKLPVPAVYYSNEHVIIMEYIETHHSVDDTAQRHAADLLAELHGIQSDQYGLERDTSAGSLPQPNKQNKSWIDFFAENRLIHMAQEALKEDKVDKKFMKQIEKLAGKLSNFIKSPAPPSLIHGDVWTGNILAGRSRIAAFLDPAIYYADPEIELAFIKLLNTFGEPFFKRYHELRPIKPGFFEERAEIYSLYPLLLHTRIFGVSYARKAQRVLDKFT